MVIIELKTDNIAELNDLDVITFFQRFSFYPIITSKDFETNTLMIRPKGNLNLFHLYKNIPEDCQFGRIMVYFEYCEQLIVAYHIIEYNGKLLSYLELCSENQCQAAIKNQ
ncbi:hypothetical protein RF11_02776 [Thelohanellus kitauei]|uniref:Uncharacterized protein n=1 Tax=Thelohanellus kitauei TaxID=669202 RepID=A0A0C2MQ27_THEKT|nr:hypothetical protein RF11_02776 [Thelohanellus kitauei]